MNQHAVDQNGVIGRDQKIPARHVLAERAGLKLTGVRRLRLGRIGLDGLPPGQWRYLAAQERF